MIGPEDKRFSWSFFVSMKSFTANGNECCRRERYVRWYQHQMPATRISETEIEPRVQARKYAPWNDQSEPWLVDDDDDEKAEIIDPLQMRDNRYVSRLHWRLTSFDSLTGPARVRCLSPSNRSTSVRSQSTKNLAPPERSDEFDATFS